MSGSFSYFLSQFLGIPENNALTNLIKEYGITKKNYEMVHETKTEELPELELPKGLHYFSDGKLGLFGKMALDYLYSRMIPDEYIKTMGYIYDSNSEYHNRIFIPFFENGELVYYICRDFTGTSYLRYANPHKVNSKQFVYNIDKLQDTFFICEGVFDAVSIKNIPGTALLSANLGEIQAKKIMEKIPKRIIFVPDNDETGERTLDENVRLLIKYMPPSFNTEFFVYKIEDGIKDLNLRLIKNNKDTIDIEDCVPYKESKRIQLKQTNKRFMETF